MSLYLRVGWFSCGIAASCHNQEDLKTVVVGGCNLCWLSEFLMCCRMMVNLYKAVETE